MTLHAQNTPRRPRVLILGPGPKSPGGMWSMVDTALHSPLRDRYDMARISTHREGPAALRVAVAARAGALLLARLIARRPDLLWIHMSARGSVQRKALLMAIARPIRVPVIVHSHGSQFGDYYRDTTKPRRAVVRWVLRNADLVIALGPSWDARIQEMTPCTVAQVLNPVAVPATIDHDAKEPGLIVCTGRLGDRKGSATLVRAFALVAQRFPTARLILAGDGDAEPVRELARELAVEHRVELPGWVSSTDVTRLLGRASAFALPSRNEGLPIAMLEAMAHGVPCIVTPVGGIPDVVTNGHDALLVPPDDPTSLAAALTTILADESQAREMGDAGRQMVQSRCSTQIIAERLADCFDQVLADNRSDV